MAKKKDVHMKRNRTSAAGQILLSISILVSGREETTKDCINSLDRLRAKVPCELILTDTGCPAEIQEWLRKKADKFLKFTWCNDFAAARNVGLRAASGEWFMFMDDDEWFEDTTQLEDFFLSGEYREYNSASYIVRNYVKEDRSLWRDTRPARMVKRRSDTQFIYKVHEGLVPCLNPWKNLEDYVHHTGYVFQDEETRKAKTKRNLGLLLPLIESDFSCMHHYVQAVAEYQADDDYESAYKIADKGIKNLNPLRGDNKRYIDALYAAAVRMRVKAGLLEEACAKGKFYLKCASLSDLAAAAIQGDLAIACGAFNREEECLGYAREYLKWKDYFSENREAWALQETIVLDSTFEAAEYWTVTQWALAAAICCQNREQLDSLLGMESMAWWQNNIHTWCGKASMAKLDRVYHAMDALLEEQNPYRLQAFIEVCQGYLFREDTQYWGFEKYHEMADNYADRIIWFYQQLFQPYVLERYQGFVSDMYLMALHLQKAVHLADEGDELQALKEIKEAIQLQPSASEILNRYTKLLHQKETERQEAEEKKVQKEMEQLSAGIKERIGELLEQGQEEEALTVLAQLRTMLPKDEEIERLERQIHYRRIKNRMKEHDI